MAKIDQSLDAVIVAPDAAIVAKIDQALDTGPGAVTLDEFCSGLSQSDKRVEMIGAFHSAETSSSRFKDPLAAYQSRYSAFINAPA